MTLPYKRTQGHDAERMGMVEIALACRRLHQQYFGWRSHRPNIDNKSAIRKITPEEQAAINRKLSRIDNYIFIDGGLYLA